MSGEERTLELTLPAADYDRLQAVADDPESLVHEAVQRDLRVRESVDALEARRAGEAAPEPPEPGPLDSPVGALLGFEVIEIGEGEAMLAMDAGRRHANRGGAVQGGVITSLADTATAFAFMTTLEAGQSTTNVELKVNFLRPVFDDRLEATAAVVERGRTIGLVECDVHTSEGKLAARLSTTYMVLRGGQAEGR
jgi:uncharacterized protein (TIGR00369 family)